MVGLDGRVLGAGMEPRVGGLIDAYGSRPDNIPYGIAVLVRHSTDNVVVPVVIQPWGRGGCQCVRIGQVCSGER